MDNYSYGVLTVSDSCSNETAIDASGPLIINLIKSKFNSDATTYKLVPDELKEIEKELLYFSDELKVNIIFTTGGTGFSPRDVTPEATKNVIHREAPQLANLMFLESLKKTKYAALSRAICGVRNQTLIINFPGSKKAVQECFDAIADVSLHAVQLICNELEETTKTHASGQNSLNSSVTASTKSGGSYSGHYSVISEKSKNGSISIKYCAMDSPSNEETSSREIYLKPNKKNRGRCGVEQNYGSCCDPSPEEVGTIRVVCPRIKDTENTKPTSMSSNSKSEKGNIRYICPEATKPDAPKLSAQVCVENEEDAEVEYDYLQEPYSNRYSYSQETECVNNSGKVSDTSSTESKKLDIVRYACTQITDIDNMRDRCKNKVNKTETTPNVCQHADGNMGAIIYVCPQPIENMCTREGICPLKPAGVDICRQPAPIDKCNSSQKSTSTESSRYNIECSREKIPQQPNNLDATRRDCDGRYKCKLMVDVEDAINRIFMITKPKVKEVIVKSSPMNIPPFRAALKDGYAIQSGQSGPTRVIGSISESDDIKTYPFASNECYKIKTGAPVPDHADAIVEIEDTDIISIDEETGKETLVDILVETRKGNDIREVGSDVKVGQPLCKYDNPICIAESSVLAAVGVVPPTVNKIKVAIVSAQRELIEPENELICGSMYNSNTKMLKLLVESFGFEVHMTKIVEDKCSDMRENIICAKNACDVVICLGDVSKVNNDYGRPSIKNIGYKLQFGCVNMKPGKTVMFAHDRNTGGSFFNIPSVPVSAFIAFHLFVLPHLKYLTGTAKDKCFLPTITVKLMSASITLDSRPEYSLASIISKNGELWAEITDNQTNSPFTSIIEADCFVCLPAKTSQKSCIATGMKLKAVILKHDFISKYE